MTKLTHPNDSDNIWIFAPKITYFWNKQSFGAKIQISCLVCFLNQKSLSRHIDECIYVIYVSKNEYFVVWGLYQVYIRNIKVLTSFIRLKGKSSTLASQRKIDYVQQRKMHLLYHFSSCYAQDHSVLKSAKNSSFKF